MQIAISTGKASTAAQPYDVSLDVQQAVSGLGIACASHAAVSWADGGRLSIAQHAQMMKALLSLWCLLRRDAGLQIIYYNDDTSAANELKSALADQESSPVYIPNFGNVQVSGVTMGSTPTPS